MKNLKKILSVFMAITIIFAMTTVSFAAALSDSTVYTLELVASEKVTAGSEFTVAIYLKDGSNDIEFSGIGANIAVYYPTQLAQPTVTASNSMTTGDCTFGDGIANLMFDNENWTPVFNASTPIATLTFIALNAGDVYNFTVENGGILDYTGTEAQTTEVNTSVTVGGGEEVFEPTYEGVKAEDGTVTEGFASGSKVATVFAKATGNLAAGEYGIVFGGHKYVGADDVLDGNYWVIRLYDPSGNILTGASYTCQKFVGDAYETVDYELETK